MDLLRESYKWGNGSLPDNTKSGLPDLPSGDTVLMDRFKRMRDDAELLKREYDNQKKRWEDFKKSPFGALLDNNPDPLLNLMLDGTRLYKDGWRFHTEIPGYNSNRFYFQMRRNL
jgi:hypothetical protein